MPRQRSPPRPGSVLPIDLFTVPPPFLFRTHPVDYINSLFDSLTKGGISVAIKLLALLFFLGGIAIATGPVVGDERMGGHGRKILGGVAIGGIVMLGAVGLATALSSLVAH